MIVHLTTVPAGPGGIALAIHGGAGRRSEPLTADTARGYHAGLHRALTAGQRVLRAGGPALDAVCAAVVELENDEHFNAARGAALTAGGTAELDAAVMTGDGRAGAVTVCRTARNPVLAARAVLEHTPHLLLADPSSEWLRERGLAQEPPEYFITARRVRELARIDGPGYEPEAPSGTVGAVARDATGALAAATSTGGVTGQLTGRVGDTPVVGAGTFAADATAAVSCTGQGEFFLRGVVAYDVSARMRYLGTDLEAAVRGTIATALDAAGGWGGLIAVGADGRAVLAHNSPAMFGGYLGPDGPVTLV